MVVVGRGVCSHGLTNDSQQIIYKISFKRYICQNVIEYDDNSDNKGRGGRSPLGGQSLDGVVHFPYHIVDSPIIEQLYYN